MEPNMTRPASEAASPPALESGTYEVLRNRLQEREQELQKRLEVLNKSRQEVFGSIPTALLATERITTEHNCVARDMVSLGNNRFLFGYNVFLGLKTETVITDVFAAYEKKGHSFSQVPLDFLSDPNFLSEFRVLYRYYRNTIFARFSTPGNFLYMVFQISANPKDIKAFKWQIDGSKLTYLGNRFDHEVVFPPQHEFVWTRTRRDFHRAGPHPHISIQDRVFVETIGGDLTIKIEDNTQTGSGIYAEPVEYPDQTLDDAEIYYASVGSLILLKIRPYQEKNFRYFAFNEKIKEVKRIDAMAHSCVLLPSDHGIVFSNGYYLQLGQFKEFPADSTEMCFKKRRQAPNGEDYLFTFYRPETGDFVLLSYNVILQRVDTPIRCNGYCFFENGELAFFKDDQSPKKHHTIQIWQTPYLDQNVPLPVKKDNFLFKIGNQSIVRCMSECQELLTLLRKDDSYAGLFVDIVRKSNEIVDTFFWIDSDDAQNIKAVILAISEAASAAVDEFEKVSRIRKETNAAIEASAQKTQDILKSIQSRTWEHIHDFVSTLTDIRSLRGELSLLKERRYADINRIDKLIENVVEKGEQTASKCLEFLQQPQALAPYQAEIAEHVSQIASLAKVVDVKAVEEKVEQTAQGLALLTDTVSHLPSSDATQTTQILDAISTVFASLNAAKAQLKRRRLELQEVEGAAHFGAQIRLLEQSQASLLEMAATPQLCDEYLNRILAQIQEVETRFAEFDVFFDKLIEKRETVSAAFASRKMALVDARNRRTESLLHSSERILQGISQRFQSQSSMADLESYFVSDPMVHRVQEIIAELIQADDSVKASDLQTRLATLKQEAIRKLKDRLELFVDGKNIIQFGEHKFRVQSQELDATLLLRDQKPHCHLTGTGFYELVEDPILSQTETVWRQEVVSENETVYRGEYLAYQWFKSYETDRDSLERMAQANPDEQLRALQRFMQPRFAEGYLKGVHDCDGAQILNALLDAHLNLGLLRYSGSVRAIALLFWHEHKAQNPLLAAKLEACRIRNYILPGLGQQNVFIQEIEKAIEPWLNQHMNSFQIRYARQAAEYLYHQFTATIEPVVSPEAMKLSVDFDRHLQTQDQRAAFRIACDGVKDSPCNAFLVIKDWLECFEATRSRPEARDFMDEAAVLLMRQAALENPAEPRSPAFASLEGMRGNHPVIVDQKYSFDYHHFIEKLGRFDAEMVPLYQKYQSRKLQISEGYRQKLRLGDLKSNVLTTFVRNQLIDRSYLPLIGANLAKQIGTAGPNARTDRMGLLLLISPPGYGKTTLMEYIANCLGLVFLKINGPTLGGHVTSLDPGEARNAAAREELEKLNLGLEMGDNVMIYVDDIQHCNPEFLQKFISLCDAQRRIEGVWRGRSRTYDFRGKRVAVVMAGNPYTESGARFQIPDMLANRADTYNLGEIVAGSAELFQTSYLENALTSNATLSKLSRSPKDFHAILALVQSGQAPSVMEGNYTPEELSEFASVIRKLLRVREVVLRINEEYIRSAAQMEEHRTEPAFRLQGSYRNMNRMAERILPIMNDEEVEHLIWDHYQREAQTLASQAELNLLKLKEILGRQSPEEKQRWDHIKQTFRRNLLFQSSGGQDPVSRIIAQLTTFTDALGSIEKTLSQGLKSKAPTAESLKDNEDHQLLKRQLDVIKESVQALSQSLSMPKISSSETSPVPLFLNEVTQNIQNLRESLAAILKHLQQQTTFRLIDPSSPSDYQITSVSQQTLSKIWALIESERGSNLPKPPVDLSNQPLDRE